MRELEAVIFSYMYRDASNYKAWGRVVFHNAEGLSIQEVDSRLRGAYESETFFTADQVQVPEVFLYTNGIVTVDDHCFHAFHSVEYTSDDPTDMHDRSIQVFVEQSEREGQNGWRVFDPLEKARAYRNRS